MLIVAWALGVAVSGTRIDGVTPAGAQLRGAGQGQRRAADARRPARSRRSTTSSAPASSRATSSPSRPSGSSTSSAGDPRMRRDPDVTRAGASVLKIRGTNDCGRGVEGSGFVYAGDRLITNAHVVAGVDDPQVYRHAPTTPSTPTTVFYDPDLDIAVLEFDSGEIPPLRLTREDDPTLPKDDIAILGYPLDGGFDIEHRPGPGRPAAAVAGHLRRRHGDPQRLLAARPGPPRQLRRPDRGLRGPGGRGGLRGVGHRRRHRLRADGRRGARRGRRRPAGRETEVSTQGCSRP